MGESTDPPESDSPPGEALTEGENDEGEGTHVHLLSRGDLLDRAGATPNAYSQSRGTLGGEVRVIATLAAPDDSEVVVACAHDSEFDCLLAYEGSDTVRRLGQGTAPPVRARQPPSAVPRTKTATPLRLPGVGDIIEHSGKRLILDRVVTPSEQVVYAVTEPLEETAADTSPRFAKLVSHGPQERPAVYHS